MSQAPPTSWLLARLAQLDRWWFCPAPALRLATMRVLIVGFGLIWLIGFGPLLLANLSFAPEQFAPVGVVALLDVPLPVWLGVLVWLASVALGVAALLGWRFSVVGPIYALALLWVASYRNSWGMVFHTENLLVLHTLIVALLPASDAWSLDARGRPSDPTEDPRYGWGLKLMATVTALAYVLAGVAKLRNAGTAWLTGDVLLTHVGWDNLRKHELGSMHSPLGAAMCVIPIVFVPLSWMSMALELGAPLALFGRRLAWAWSFGMWCFHVGVVAIMAIVFAYPLSGVAFAPLLAVERPVLALATWARRRRPDAYLTRLLPES